MKPQNNKHIVGSYLDNGTTLLCRDCGEKWLEDDLERDEILTKKDCREAKPIKYICYRCGDRIQ